MKVSKTFQKIPELLLEKGLSLRAVYMYSKMLMLSGSVYNRESWVRNPISKKNEMSVDALTDITKQLRESGLIEISKHLLGNAKYKTNEYVIVPFEGYFKPVMNDFINHTELSAEAKGLAIMLNLLKEIPTSCHAMAQAVGVSDKTVKRYKNELEEAGILTAEGLSEEYFPRLIEAARERKAEEIYNEIKNPQYPWGGERISKQIDWIDRLEVSYSQKARLAMRAEMGLLGKKKEIRPIGKDLDIIL